MKGRKRKKDWKCKGKKDGKWEIMVGVKERRKRRVGGKEIL